MEFNATFLVAMFSFVVFIFIMNTIFYKPILTIIEKRENYIKDNYQKAEQNSQEAKNILSNYNDKITLAQNECRIDSKTKIEEVQTIANNKIEDAKKQAKMVIENQKNDLINKTETLKSEVKSNVLNDLTNSITSKIMGGNND